MKIHIKDIDINYIQYGSGKKDIVLLHGWGQNICMMRPVGDLFQDNYRITILDLPGFGESMEPKDVWTIEDYSEFLDEFLTEVKVKNPILIGHSFGGRISICYSATHKVEKLCLFGSPCIRKRKELTNKEKLFKKIKNLPGMGQISEIAKKYIGSRDYKAASTKMRQILVNVINQDLSEYAKKITAPTLLIWGENDQEAPLEEAKELETIMKDAGLIVLPGTHYAYLENLNQVYRILKEFF